MSTLHSFIHKFKAILGYSIAAIVIISAILVSGVRLLLTNANLYQDEVEQLASSLLLQPVKIGRMDAELSGLVPTLIFHDVNLLSKKSNKPLFSLNRIDVGISFRDLLLQQTITPVQLTIKGMDLHLTRTIEGKFKIKGIDLAGLNEAGEDSGLFLNRWLSVQGEVAIEDSTITWKDKQNAGLTWVFDETNLLLKKEQQRYQLLLSAGLPNILGEKINLAIDLNGDITSPATLKIKSFIDSKGLNLSPLQQYVKIPNFELIGGVADLRLWLNWENQGVSKLSGDVNLDDFSYRIQKRKMVVLNAVTGMFDSYKEGNSWKVSVKNFLYKSNNKLINKSNFSLAFNYLDTKFKHFYLNADYLRLDTLAKIINDNHLLAADNESKFKKLGITGDVKKFSVAWQDNNLTSFKADFENFGVNAWQSVPELKKLSGNVYYSSNKGKLKINSEQAVVGFPGLFRQKFTFDKLSTDIAFTNTEQGLLVDIKELLANNGDAHTFSKASLWLPKNDASPYMDLQSQISRGDIAKIGRFFPVSIMQKNLVNWLDNAFVAGNVDNCTIVFNGNLKQFPFKNNEGLFNVDIDASDLTLKYLPDWPFIEKAKMTGVFTGLGMKLNLLSAEIENNKITNSSAEIPSFSNSEVKLDMSANGSTESVANFLINSPILNNAKETIESMRFNGDIATTMIMNIPLGENISKKKSLSYKGEAKLSNVAAYMASDRIDITDTGGSVFFTEKGLSSKNITSKIAGQDATMSVSSLRNDKGIVVSAEGNINPGVMLNRFEVPGADKISGLTSYKSNMLFPGKASAKKFPELTIRTDLRGVISTLPDYFAKNRELSQDLKFTTQFIGDKKIRIGLDLNKTGSAILELDQSGKNVFLDRGAVTATLNKAKLPRKKILYIDGDFKTLTPSKWIKALSLNKKGKKQTFFVRPVVLNLENLGIALEKEKDNKGVEHSNPKYLPKFEGIIKKLSWDNIFLGRMDFKTSKRKYGMRFEEVILSARHMKLFAHGDWRYNRAKHKTDMSVTISTHNFGGMLTDLGFAAIIDKGEANTVAKINWQASPAQFSFDKLNGKIQLHIKDGNIKEVDAEAGRLLGLFSLSALPRKLFGDFKDTFKSGFSFDKANGEITLETGDAYMEDFEISSTVAKIYISGRTGVADRDYENVVEVVPEVGEGLAGITALLVNLPAGLGVWLVDKITGEKINEASSRLYEISGSWDKPDIRLVEDE